MKIGNEQKELLALSIIIAAAIGIFLIYYFGLAGFKVFTGIIMAAIPFYIFLNTFSLDEGEKIILSLIFGVTLFPSFVYLLGFIVSFRMSIGIVFIVLTLISALWSHLRPKKQLFS